jgi:hypothetical protein
VTAHGAVWPPPDPDDGAHMCPAAGCGAQVPFGRLLCGPDWYRVPKAVRTAVLQAWAGGDGLGSAAHAAAMRRAIGAVDRARAHEAEDTALFGGGAR